jgi:hypothetical protein
MSKFESLNTVMSLSEAKKYLEQITEDLDAIYLSAEAPSGTAGTVWRQFWGNPRQITPLTLYLREMIMEEVETSQVMLKKQAKELRAKAKADLQKKLEQVTLSAEEQIQFAESILVENDELHEKLEESANDRKELRRLQLIEKAENRPSMLKAQARDIAYLIEELKPLRGVDFSKLHSFKMQQDIKEEIEEEQKEKRKEMKKSNKNKKDPSKTSEKSKKSSVDKPKKGKK